MSKVSQGTVLFLSGLVLITVVGFGIHTRYVKPVFGITLIVSGLLLVVLAVLTFRQSTADDDHDDHDCDDHAHSPRVGWLLMAPIVVMALVVPPALGADAAQRQDDSLQAPQAISDADLLPPLPDGDTPELDLATFVMHASVDEGKTIQGKPVKLLGFVTPAEDGSWFVTRMTIQCCAGDAFAFKVRVTDTPAPPTDSWVMVTGEFVPEVLDPEIPIPQFKVADIKEADAPDPEYL